MLNSYMEHSPQMNNFILRNSNFEVFLVHHNTPEYDKIYEPLQQANTLLN